MTRFIPQSDMSADQLVWLSHEAQAIVSLCKRTTDDLPAHEPTAVLSEIGLALGVALEMLQVMHDAIEAHEGPEGGAA